MAPKVSEEHMEARKEQILSAAIACFSEKGFHKTSMKDICTKAALSPGAVYSYFEGKDEIIESVCRSGEEQNRAIFQATREVDGGPRQQIEFNLTGYQTMMEYPGIEQWLKADLMFYAEALTNERLKKLGHRNYQTIFNELCSAVESWKKAGFINKELKTDAISQVLFAMIQGLGTQRIINPELNLDAYFDVLKSMIFGEFNTEK